MELNQELGETVDIVLTVLLQDREDAKKLFLAGLEPKHMPMHRVLVERLQIACLDDTNPYDILVCIDGLEFRQKYLHLFTNTYITTLNVMFFLKRIILNYEKDIMNTILTQAAVDCGNISHCDPPEYLEMLRQDIRERLGKSSFQSMSSAPTLRDINSSLRHMYSNNDPSSTQYLTGFETVDACTRGIRRGEMLGLAGLSGQGKTTLALNIASNLIRMGMKVIYFCSEMTVESLAQNFYSIHAKIPYLDLTEKALSKSDYRRFIKAMDEMEAGENIIFNDSCRNQWEPTHNEILKFARKNNDCVVIVDYIQQQSVMNKKFRSSKEEIDHVSKSLKDLTQKHKLITICLAQLNREAMNSMNENVDDPNYLGRKCIKDTNNIYQDCDTVYTIKNRDVAVKMGKKNGRGFDSNVDEVKKIPFLGVAKCRHDYTPCNIRLDFDSSTKTFREYEG